MAAAGWGKHPRCQAQKGIEHSFTGMRVLSTESAQMFDLWFQLSAVCAGLSTVHASRQAPAMVLVSCIKDLLIWPDTWQCGAGQQGCRG